MSNSGGKSSDDDATKVIYNKVDRLQQTVMVPDRNAPDAVAGKVIGIADVRGAKMPGQDGAGKGDATVFVPAQAGQTAQGTAFDPVVGWLVVIDGPGRGQFRPVYYGQNSLGRGEDLRIALDFGDQRISREAHAFVIYDEYERQFFVKDNGKSNIVRLNGNMVLTPTEIKTRDTISVGQTTLLFVALCDGTFDWLANDAQKSS
jgi:hypothetical protein